ncbi:MAG TPA: serine/threonine-protein kinase, partial [Candidatus Nanopelagicales bacterium]|nr:serine/threonine-protein kinase [Candidatus Nanopelagicales bacterium]
HRGGDGLGGRAYALGGERVERVERVEGGSALRFTAVAGRAPRPPRFPLQPRPRLRYHRPVELRPGLRIDRYTLVEPLGRGGQGSVWKVVDPLDGGAVRALKLIRLRGLDAGTVERARREARAVVGAAHPALVPCRALFEELGAELLGLVFDFVPGQSLLAAARDPRMSASHRDTALRQVAGALAHVHGLGLVHRDIKPENVQITEAFWAAPATPGGVRLLDFGIAAPVGNTRGITAPGTVIGTRTDLAPELLAPGLWLPQPEGYSRDLFAFGVLAWELCCGVHPTGLGAEAPGEAYVDAYRAADAGHRPWPPMPAAGALEGRLGAAVGACLQIDPRRRPPHGGALLEILGPPPTVVGSIPPTVSSGSAGVDVTAPTAVHAQATGLATAPTAMQPAPPGIHSAPMMHSAPTMHSAAARSSRLPLFLGVGLLVFVVLAGGAGFLALRGRPRGRAAERVRVEPSAAPAPSAAPEASIPVPCCPKQGSCPLKGRPCAPLPCKDESLPERSFWLKPIGVAGRGDGKWNENVAGDRPKAELCLRLGEVQSCAPILQAMNGRVALPVQTSDVVNGAVEVRITDQGTVVAAGRIAPNPEGFLSSVLCKGLLLYVGKKEQASVRFAAELTEAP